MYVTSKKNDSNSFFIWIVILLNEV